MVHSDTAALPRGDGTMGSRSLQVGGSAVAEAADQVLNRAYAMAMEVAQGRGEAQEASLREAQRAWIAFRDRACEAEALLFEGGTAQPLTGTACLVRLSSVRTGDLRRYVGMTLP